ncbi:NUDIX domain-containing protein [Streptomyces sp. SCSIO 30461]|uniref:NUDIX domain-containing protein n=1 Tax=Streptomyces sp. SCSIO 30461 TaxID=3118085 RepID=UPI0030CEDD82
MRLIPELPRISVSVKATIVRDGAVLLLSYDDESGFHYNLPGGKAQVGEDLRQAVTRKVAQETGLQVVARRLLCVVEYVPDSWKGEFGGVQKVQFNFLAEQVDDAEPRVPDPPEPDQVGVEWIPLERLGDVYLLPRINRPLLAALSGELADPFVDRW